MPLLFALLLLYPITVIVVVRSRWYKNREARKKQMKLLESMERTRPAREERFRFMQEEFFPVFKEMFRKGPVGYWSDPRDAFSRVVSYED